MTLERTIYAPLKDAILAFVAGHAHPAIAPFKAAMAACGDEWCGGTVNVLPAASFLAPARATANAETRDLTELFERAKDRLHWEQSYTKADAVVGDDMLAGYGFVEVIGKRGPFVSDRVRSGIGVWGPGITYPAHRHQAEEVYVPLAGSARFDVDGRAPQIGRAGDAIDVPPMRVHGFTTTDEPLVVFYIWQAGDLREKSTFL